MSYYFDILRAAKALFASCSGLSIECWGGLPQRQRERWIKDAASCVAAYQKDS